MPPSGLTKDQSEILKGMWERGMKSTKEKKKISKAIKRTGLSEKVIKNWIGNERRRRGQATKRPTKRAAIPKYIPGAKRKKSAYAIFKSEFLSGEKAKKMMADGCSPSAIQAEGNRQYRLLQDQEWDAYNKIAEQANKKEDKEAKSKEAQVNRLIASIQANMKKLEELDFPSIWMGKDVKKNIYSSSLKSLQKSKIFTDNVPSEIERAALAPCRKDQRRERSSDESDELLEEQEPLSSSKKTATASTSQSNRSEDEADQIDDVPTMCSGEESDSSELNEGDEVEILAVAGSGSVTKQTSVHGKELGAGWIPLLVTEIAPTISPWPEYPTHSGQVERKSFIAWPQTWLRRKVRR